ncbi:hypothetical protein [Halomonas dongshanensis]|uniref:Serine/threonine protein phosphatase n=1 Tax=Halomonas dongshanensis TaxID=2890835 RepID=A0ABT2E845_9GAMM|nr:hypothetical protein [Halomonas dongshanensis]MCS2607738.1 hypothetical protein [Halomonas dongshanensis]
MYDLFLLDTYSKQQDTMAPHVVEGRKVWLKRAAKRNSRLSYLPLSVLAKWLKVDAFKPVPNLGGEKSILTEASRIQTLAQAGIAVPTILAQQPQALLLADAGDNGQPAVTFLEKLERSQTPDEVDATLAQGITALNRVHAQGCYLSEAFARNILMAGEQTVFIDFETDPGTVLSPVDCMVRDWYCLIFSLYGKFHKRPLQGERLAPALLTGLQQASQPVRERFRDTLPHLLRLKRIPFRRFGSDGRKIAYTLQALVILQHGL